jgi:hypothetical protein
MSADRHIRDRAARLGGEASLAGDVLTVRTGGGEEIQVPVPASWDSLLDFRHALPGRARGDQRELLVAGAVQDAAPSTGRQPDSELREALGQPGVLPVADEVERNVLASIMRDHYWVRPESTARTSRPFAFPFHAAIPANYSPPGRYKMYRSDILLFLSWDGSDIDPAPVEALCELLSDMGGFTLLDELLVAAALATSGDGATDHVGAADLIASDQAAKVRGYLASGAFHQPALDRFRADMLAALSMPLPRHDRVEAAILTLSLHLGLYYYEIAYRLGTGLEAATRAAAALGPEPPPAFAGRLLFRVGTAGDRPVRRADGCAAAWRELDDRYLISLVPNIVAANLLHRCWQAARPGDAPENADPTALAVFLDADRDLGELVDGAAGALAILYAERVASASAGELAAIAASDEPGTYLLRSGIHSHLRRTLHYRSRAVVNQLVKRSFGGSLIRRRGNVLFFELDEDLLFLLVKFVLARRGDAELPLGEFLSELAAYGLAPQDRDEEDELAAALERLGMLHRYSDAGEAIYVRHLL